MLITLTTDFGLQDGYVGVMKGVMASIAPQVPMIDLSHLIPPQDVRSAAYLLWTALPYFPAESVHLVVVDPGVGTSRRPIAASTAWGYLVGPDNGVFSYVWAATPPTRIVTLANPRYRREGVSQTFHGRDIFAPAAAHLAAGVAIEALGEVVDDPVRLPLPQLSIGPRIVRGEVLYVDHFGNCITSVGYLTWDGDHLRLDPAFGGGEQRILPATRLTVRSRGVVLHGVQRTYGLVAEGEPLALVGSEGMLEIAVSNGNAGRTLGLRVGDPVEVSW